MDIEIAWSPEAIEDLVSIAEYIARDSGFYARAIVTEVFSVSRNIREFPLIGRIVPEVGDHNLRERFVYSYRLVYHIRPDHILIVAVIHGRRLLENLSERLDGNK